MQRYILFILAATLWSTPAFSDRVSAESILASIDTRTGLDKPAALALVDATAKVKGIDAARRLIDELTERFPEPELREKLVAACADLSDFDCASYEAARIQPFNWRMRALSQIASAYAEQGSPAKAQSAFVSILQGIERDAPAAYRDQLLVGLLGSVVEFSFFDVGLNAARSIKNLEKRAEALFVVSLAASREGQMDVAAVAYREAHDSLDRNDRLPREWMLARAGAAAAALGRDNDAEHFLSSIDRTDLADWAYAEIAAMLHYRGRSQDAAAWEARVRSPERNEWLLSLVAETFMRAGNCAEAVARWKLIASPSWSAATLLHLAEANGRQRCIGGATLADEIVSAWRDLPEDEPARTLIGAQLAAALAATSKPNSN